MDPYEQKLKAFIADHNIKAEHLHFDASCHSVQEAALAVNASPEDFIKSICLMDVNGSLIVAIVKGEDRVDIALVGQFLGIDKPRIATPVEMLDKTGYPCGGTPPFGFQAIFLIDEKVMEKETVYAGGGSDHALVKISPGDIQKANGGKIVQIRENLE